MIRDEHPSDTIMPRVDRGVLDSLIEVIGEESVRRFLAEFQEQAAMHRFAIQTAHEASDNEALYRESHYLVSTSGNLGIKRASKLVDAVQRATRMQDRTELDCAIGSAGLVPSGSL